MEIAAIFLPLVAAFIAGFFGRRLGDRLSQLVTCAAVLTSAGLSVALFIDVALGGIPGSSRSPRGFPAAPSMSTGR